MSTRLLARHLVSIRGATVVFCAVVLTLAWMSYRQFAESYRTEAHARLGAIAEMKAGEVADWRRERLADGQFFKDNRAAIDLMRRAFGPAGDAAAAATLLDLLSRMQRSHEYSRVAVHDADGVERMSTPVGGPRDDGHMAAFVRDAVAGNGQAFLALHAVGGEAPHLNVIAPIQAGLGAVMARIDAVPALADVVKTWPVPARTAQTLIVRRDGDEVMFLNAVLGLDEASRLAPLPMARTELPVVRAVLGHRGTVEAVDHEGTPVVAAMMPVEGTSWHLVAVQGQDELYGPLRERAVITIAMGFLLLAAGLAGLGLVWRGHNRSLETKERGLLHKLTAMAQVVEASPVVLFQWGAREGWPVEWVSGNVARWGYTPEQLVAGEPPFSQLVHPDDIANVQMEVTRFTADGRDAFVQEYRIRTADGRILWMDDRTAVVRDAKGRVLRYEGTLADITERKSLQAQFVQAQKMETVGRLAGGVAHDFNNLLTVINGYAEFALAEVPDDHPLREMLQEIHDAGMRAAGLTRQLLAFSRRSVIQTTPVDVNAVTGHMKRMLERLIGEDVRLMVDLEPDLWTVRADAGQIEQVIMNLAVNARDAMPEGGTLMLTTRNVVNDGDWVRIEVTDTGCGMDEATQQRLFEPFFTTKAPGQGTGLGLATAYGIVSQSGGRIEVSSTVGAGSTFQVYLPRHAGGPAMPAPKVPDTGLVPGTETILLVEDEEALRRIAERILKTAGYRVVSAATGREALDVFKDGGPLPDLLLTDVVMPGMSGYDLAVEIHRTHPDLKVLFVSGYLRDAFPERVTFGPDLPFLAKPYSPSALAGAVRAVLDRA